MPIDNELNGEPNEVLLDEIQRQNVFLKSVIDSLEHPFYVIDVNDYTVKISNSASGITPGGTCHKLVFGFDTTCDLHGMTCPLQTILDTKKFETEEHTLSDDSGNKTYLEVHAHPVFDSHGNVVQIIEYSFDITARKEMEEKLQKSFEEVVSLKDKAEEASRLKSQFLAGMSHDIRTPLNAVMGFTDLLLKSERRARPRKYLDKIKNSGEGLLNLINDILDFSKIEAGQLDIYPRTFRPLGLVDNLRSIFEMPFNQKSIHFSIEVSGSVPHAVCNDRWRIHQVLTNLLSNSLKFTPNGTVSLHVDYEEPADMMVFKVTDTGIGIEPRNQENIFDPFIQVQPNGNIHQEGAGLGLAICKKLVALMEGDLSLDSTPGKGTRFKVNIPANTTGVREEHLEPAKETSTGESVPYLDFKTGNTILIADDNEVNRELISEQLSSTGFQFLMLAENGKQAVEIAMEHSPDLVLMDIRMPEMDGNQAIAQLRKKGYSGPIIALSAYAMREDIDRSLEAGADAYIAKPINFDTFFARISGFLKIKVPRVDGSSQPYKNKRIPDDMIFTISASVSPKMKKLFIADLEKKGKHIMEILHSGYFETHKETLESIAHSYGGNAAHFGVPSLESVALQMEGALKEGEPETRQIELVRTLVYIMEKIIQQNKKV
ncbi:MAG: response regulator [bacterium]|nr:response regulator [bacterium]